MAKDIIDRTREIHMETHALKNAIRWLSFEQKNQFNVLVEAWDQAALAYAYLPDLDDPAYKLRLKVARKLERHAKSLEKMLNPPTRIACSCDCPIMG